MLTLAVRAERSPFRHLIYPLPEEGGLGVHLTLDLQGQAKFGPDVQWVEEVRQAVLYTVRCPQAQAPDIGPGALWLAAAVVPASRECSAVGSCLPPL